MPIKENVSQKLKQLIRFLDRVPDIAGTEAVSFSRENFEKQGWSDGTFSPWQRKKVDNGYPVLRSKNPNGLVDTIHYEKTGPFSVIVRAGGPNKPYARVHNEGGVIVVPVTPKMRKWAWAMFNKTKNPKYKAMALQKNSSMRITMPRRQYIGESKDLIRNIETVIYNNFKRILR